MGAIGIGTPIYYHSTPIRPGAVVDKPEFVFEVLVSNAGDTIDLETVNGGSGFPNFKINWGEGPDQTSTSKTNNHTYANTGTYVIKINKSGTVTPVNNFSVLATNQGKAMVTKVTDWGDNEWYSLRAAFADCVNLETLSSDTKLKTAPVTSELFGFTFIRCTSLQAADMTNWVVNSDTSNAAYRWRMQETFNGCSNLALIRPPSSKVMPVDYFQKVFLGCGTALVGGTVVKNFDNLDFSTSTANSWDGLFENAKLSGDVNLSNWNINPEMVITVDMFRFCELTGDSPTLNCSGWTSLQASNFGGMFRQVNCLATEENNLTIDVSNLNISKATSLGTFFGYGPNSDSFPNRVENIIGLSTWVAPNTDPSDPQPGDGQVQMTMFFGNCPYLKLVASDNLSDTFVNGAKPTSIAGAFGNIGYKRAIGDKGVAPNLGSLDLSNVTGTGNLVGMDSVFFRTNTSDLIDISGVTFPTATVSYKSFIRAYQSDNPGELDLSTKTIKSSSFNGFARNDLSATSVGTGFTKIIFGNEDEGTDFSSCVTFAYAFYLGGLAATPLEVILPTDANYGSVVLAGWTNSFFSLNGPGGVNLTTCVVNTLIRRLKATALTGSGQLINLNLNSKYSGPQALVGNDLAELQAATPPYTFGTLSPELPYFSIPNYISPGGTIQNITFATGVATDGTWTVTNGVATIDNSTPASPTITAATNGNGVIRYTLTDGCYNEVNFTATIPLIANNFSFNFDGINNYLQVGPQSNFAYGTGDFTISSWIYPERINDTYELIWSQGGGASTGTNYLSLFNDQLAYYDGFNHQIVSPAGSIKDYEWQQVTIRRTSGVTQLFINGIPSGNSSTVQDESIAQPTVVTIGKWSIASGLQHNFKGKMDELFIYNIALTNPQILDIYNGRLGVTNETVDLSGYDGLGGNLVYWNRMGD